MQQLLANLSWNNHLSLLGWLFVLVGAILFLNLLNGLRTGQLRHQFKSMGELREHYLGIPQTRAERQRSESEGGHPAMPVIGFLASLGIILIGLLLLGVIH